MRVIKFREEFLTDRDKIFDFICHEFGLIYADIFLEEIEKITEMLSIFPEVGRQVQNNKIYKFNFGQNRYLYTFDSKKIFFVGLIDTRRNLKAIMLS